MSMPFGIPGNTDISTGKKRFEADELDDIKELTVHTHILLELDREHVLMPCFEGAVELTRSELARHILSVKGANSCVRIEFLEPLPSTEIFYTPEGAIAFFDTKKEVVGLELFGEFGKTPGKVRARGTWAFSCSRSDSEALLETLTRAFGLRRSGRWQELRKWQADEKTNNCKLVVGSVSDPPSSDQRLKRAKVVPRPSSTDDGKFLPSDVWSQFTSLGSGGKGRSFPKANRQSHSRGWALVRGEDSRRERERSRSSVFGAQQQRVKLKKKLQGASSSSSSSPKKRDAVITLSDDEEEEEEELLVVDDDEFSESSEEGRYGFVSKKVSREVVDLRRFHTQEELGDAFILGRAVSGTLQLTSGIRVDARTAIDPFLETLRESGAKGSGADSEFLVRYPSILALDDRRERTGADAMELMPPYLKRCCQVADQHIFDAIKGNLDDVDLPAKGEEARAAIMAQMQTFPTTISSEFIDPMYWVDDYLGDISEPISNSAALVHHARHRQAISKTREEQIGCWADISRHDDWQRWGLRGNATMMSAMVKAVVRREVVPWPGLRVRGRIPKPCGTISDNVREHTLYVEEHADGRFRVPCGALEGFWRAMSLQGMPSVPERFGRWYVASERETLPIAGSDLERLSPGQYLSDANVDFFMKYAERRILDSDLHRGRVHIFSSQFYSELARKASEKRWVTSWTRRLDVFSKDLLVVPVNQHMHWSLALVYNPGALMQQLDRAEATRRSAAPTASVVEYLALVNRIESNVCRSASETGEVLTKTDIDVRIEAEVQRFVLEEGDEWLEMLPCPPRTAGDRTEAVEMEGMPYVPTRWSRAELEAYVPGEGLLLPPDSAFVTGRRPPLGGPGREVESEERTWILFLDSLRSHSPKAIADNVRSWLVAEWRTRRRNGLESATRHVSTEDVAQWVPLAVLDCPEQENGCDCGVFATMGVERTLVAVRSHDIDVLRHARTPENAKAALANTYAFNQRLVHRKRELMQRLVRILAADPVLRAWRSVPNCIGDGIPPWADPPQVWALRDPGRADPNARVAFQRAPLWGAGQRIFCPRAFLARSPHAFIRYHSKLHSLQVPKPLRPIKGDQEQKEEIPPQEAIVIDSEDDMDSELDQLRNQISSNLPPAGTKRDFDQLRSIQDGMNKTVKLL